MTAPTLSRFTRLMRLLAVALLAVTGSRVQSLTDDPQLQQLRAQRELQRYSVRDLDAYVGDIVSATKVRKNPQAFLQ